MNAMQMDSDIASEELHNCFFGTDDQNPSILANSEFDCFDDAIIYEDYCGLHIYGENFSPPTSSALNESTTKYLESFKHDQDLGVGVHDEPHASQHSEQMKTIHSKPLQLQAEKKNGHRRSLKRAVKISPREMLKAYSVLHPSASKDGHTKVATSRGLRDRRIRLSFETAIKFFLVQDRLGFDQPSKALEWLIEKCKPAIEELPKVPSYGSLTKEGYNYKGDYVMESLGISQASMEPCTMEGPIPIDSTFSGDQSHIDIFSCLYPSFDYGECDLQTSTVNSSIEGLNSTVTPLYSATNHHAQL